MIAREANSAQQCLDFLDRLVKLIVFVQGRRFTVSFVGPPDSTGMIAAAMVSLRE